jgi:hypothetical protein
MRGQEKAARFCKDLYPTNEYERSPVTPGDLERMQSMISRGLGVREIDQRLQVWGEGRYTYAVVRQRRRTLLKHLRPCLPSKDVSLTETALPTKEKILQEYFQTADGSGTPLSIRKQLTGLYPSMDFTHKEITNMKPFLKLKP